MYDPDRFLTNCMYYGNNRLYLRSYYPEPDDDGYLQCRCCGGEMRDPEGHLDACIYCGRDLALLLISLIYGCRTKLFVIVSLAH
jgi:hypothetical protein